MSTEFQQNIKSWVQIDNQIKRMNDNIKDLRRRITNIQDHITIYAEKNKLDKSLTKASKN